MSSTALDFGDAAQSDIRVVSFGNVSTDAQSHDLSVDNVIDRLLVVHVSQRECLSASETLNVRNAATVGNIPKLQSELENHLSSSPCLILHYGTYDIDFESMIVLGRLIAAKGGGKIPVAFCVAPNITVSGEDFILADALPDALLNGVSVFFNVQMHSDLRTICAQFGRCAMMARERRLDISSIKFIMIIDRTAGFILGSLIRDEGDDRAYLFDEVRNSGDSHRQKNDLTTKYLPQVESMQEPKPTLMTKDWEASMLMHAFRNAHCPPTMVEIAKFPLDQLGFILAYNPFGKSHVIALTLLPDKGVQVKKLLESWINLVIGTPSMFIRAE